MNPWWAGQVHAWRSALGDIRRRPFAWLASASVVASAVVLPVLLHLIVAALTPALREIAVDPEISVYLALDASSGDFGEAQALIDEQLNTLRRQIDGAVLTLTPVPKAEALRQFRAQAERAGNAAALAALKDNPLPDGFVIRTAHVPAARIDALAADLRKLPKVDAVQLDAEWVRRLNSAVQVFAALQWMLAGMFGAVIVAMTFITTHAQVLGLRDEIDVARLIGATKAFVRRPFVVRGALLGCMGAAIALGVTAAVIAAAVRVFGIDAAPSAAGAARDALIVIVLAVLLGATGGWWSATRHLARVET